MPTRDEYRAHIKSERKMMYMAIMGAIMLALVSCGAYQQPSGTLVTETHVVIPGDTLYEIAYMYILKSSKPREWREFKEGIIENNWTIFEGRHPKDRIYPGDRLQINYWVEEKP